MGVILSTSAVAYVPWPRGADDLLRCCAGRLRPRETRNVKRLSLAFSAVLAFFCTLPCNSSPLVMRLRTCVQAAQLAAGAGSRGIADENTAPFLRQSPVDGLHSLENTRDKVDDFHLTSAAAGVKRHSFLSNF